ncbi:DUF7010 family protein [Hymenobacter cellulosilyticus]|uniref:Uncharacterized protein n=1 Tax=Hymenobacter cellulosilyticus TaxID=2932248 RepID=A0A8T9QEH7_9BACT|nr:hypothetical protein [Hymenobacter cellulosilyticus]UOQ74821.1 hypothetical protein MUN79_13685 [Hymenobacter cellulosilyticus]
MSAQLNLDALRLELSVKAKNGLDFIVAASLIWTAITLIWMLPNSPGRNGLFTLCLSGVMLPMALLFSKVFRTTWTIKDNPIQPLGLWLNFAQLFYFPILIFMYIKHPQYFIMTYGIITGAHFFPYAWFYNTKSFAIMAGVIALGCMVLGTRLPVEKLYYIPGFTVASLLLLAGWLYLDYQKKRQQAPALVAAAA